MLKRTPMLKRKGETTARVRWWAAAGLAYLMLACLVLAVVGCGSGPQRPPQGIPIGDTGFMRARLAHEARERMEEQGVASLAITVVDRNGPIYEAAFGKADKEGNIAASVDTPYRWGSNSKLFTMLALLQLSARGQVDLDAPLIRYLPDFRLRPPPDHLPESADWRLESITLRSMLTHHSGIPNDILTGLMTERPFELSEFVRRMNGMRAQHPVNLVHSYSNAAYSLLGVVVERVSGMSFDDYVRQHIFRPVGMDQASFEWNPWLEQTVARPYDQDGKRRKIYKVSGLSAGALKASTREMGLFASALLRGGVGTRGRFISSELLASSYERQNEHVALDLDQQQGLSWFIDHMAPERFGHNVQHGGGILSHFSAFALSLEHGLGVAAATNSQGGARAVHALAEEALALAIEVKTGRYPPKLDDEPDVGLAEDVDPAVLDAWTGHWATFLGAIEVRREGDVLTFDAMGQRLFLKPLKDGRMSLWAELWGLFDVQPGNLDQERLSLLQIDGRIVGAQEHHGKRRLLGVRYTPTPATAAWRGRVGLYKAEWPPGDFDLLRGVQLFIGSGGQLMSRPLLDAAAGPVPSSFALRVIDDQTVVSEGFGRNLGIVLTADEHGNLHRAGLTFRKLTEAEMRALQEQHKQPKKKRPRSKPWQRR